MGLSPLVDKESDDDMSDDKNIKDKHAKALGKLEEARNEFYSLVQDFVNGNIMKGNITALGPVMMLAVPAILKTTLLDAPSEKVHKVLTIGIRRLGEDLIAMAETAKFDDGAELNALLAKLDIKDNPTPETVH